jgi:hypothetical protein
MYEKACQLLIRRQATDDYHFVDKATNFAVLLGRKITPDLEQESLDNDTTSNSLFDLVVYERGTALLAGDETSHHLQQHYCTTKIGLLRTRQQFLMCRYSNEPSRSSRDAIFLGLVHYVLPYRLYCTVLYHTGAGIARNQLCR